MLAAIPTGLPPATLSRSAKWGVAHSNRDGDLPGAKGAGGYLEYYVEPEKKSDGFGARRLVVEVKTGRRFYSDNHYGDGGKTPAFYLLKPWIDTSV